MPVTILLANGDYIESPARLGEVVETISVALSRKHLVTMTGGVAFNPTHVVSVKEASHAS